MHITVAIDEHQRAKTSLDFVAKIGLPDAEIDVVHVIEGLAPASTPQPPAVRMDLIERYMDLRKEEGESLLQSARDAAQKSGFSGAETHLLFGPVGNQLIDYTTSQSSDLLVVGASGKGSLEGILIGSVTRKAVIGAQSSVLVVKNPAPKDRPLTVVVATDHSPYADGCLATFARWTPKGIGRLVMVTVYPEALVKAMTSLMEHFKADMDGWVRKELHAANSRSLKPFQDQGLAVTSRVESGPVSETLEQVMREEKADLLVLGAQGHGFVERLTMGSISLGQVVNKPYSVLVMRHKA